MTPPAGDASGSDALVGSRSRLSVRGRVAAMILVLACLQGVPYITQTISARVLGPEEFGHVRMMELVLGVLTLLAAFGQPSAVVRFIAAATSPTRRGTILGSAIRASFVASLVVAAIAALLFDWMPWTRGLPPSFRWLLVALPFTIANRVIAAFLQGSERFGETAVVGAFVAGVGIAGVWFSVVSYGLIGWVVGRLVSELLPTTILLWRYRSEISRRAAEDAGQMRRFGAQMTASLVLDRLVGVADNFVLSSVGGTALALGQYGAATLVVQGSLLLPAAVTAVLLPRFASAAHALTALRPLVRRAALPYATWTVVLTAALAIAGPFLLTGVLGDSYGESARLLRLLALVFGLTAAAQFGGAILIARGRGDLAIVQSAIGLVGAVALSLLLLPRFGLDGLAIAAVAAAALRLVVMTVVARRAMREAPGVAVS